MTKCIPLNYKFSKVQNLNTTVNFNGGEVSSDGGALLLREADEKLGMTARLAELVRDKRNQRQITHSIRSMLRQRIYALALGYEDLNDHDSLRKCLVLQTIVGTTNNLASSPTLCRLENKADRPLAVNMHKMLVENFITSYSMPPKQIILDFDATDDEIHGNQVGRFFHGYYGHYCFLPLYVFCGKKLLVSYLRSAQKDQAKHAWAILSLLVKRIRQRWPDVEIVFRGDAGFCRQQMLNWCDRKNIKYIVGLAQNSNLIKLLEPTMEQAKSAYALNSEKQRMFAEFQYAAGTWSHKRKVIGKAEVTEQGENPRFIVTNLTGEPESLYDEDYCARGDMENRIKEQKSELFAGRTSCSNWWPNQWRLLLSSLAYTLMEYIRDKLLVGTDLAKAQIDTIRLRLLKIGAVIIRNTRSIRFFLSSAYPYQDLWINVLKKLAMQ